MKNAFWALFILSCISSCDSGNPKGKEKTEGMPPAKKYLSEDLKQYDLTGKVKSVIESAYPVQYSKDSIIVRLPSDPEPEYITLFNSSGQITQKVKHFFGNDDFLGFIFVEENFIYDDENRLVRIDLYDAPALSTSEIEKGLSVDFTKRPLDSLAQWKSKVSKLYYDNKRLVCDTLLDISDKDSIRIISVARYSYKGEKLIKQTTFMGNDTVPFEIIDYTYDKNNFLIEERSWNGSDKFLLTSKIKNYPNGVAEAIQECKGVDCSITKFEYDEKGNLLNIKRSDEKGNFKMIVKYIYLFDKHGNWTSRTVIKERGMYTEERFITYY